MASTVWSSPNGTSYTINTDGIDAIMKTLRGQHVKIVHDGVAYGIYWELGHVSGNAFLQKPFLVPACEQMADPMKKAMKQAVDRGDLKTLDNVIDKVAFDVEKRTKQIITEIDLIDTGALRNSIAVSDLEGY